MAGLLGVGGGLLVVPALIVIWQGVAPALTQSVQLAIGTSLAIIALTSLSSVRAHQRRGAVMWPLFWRLAPGIAVGAWLGAMLAVGLPGIALKQLFGGFELLVAAQMGLNLRHPVVRRGLPAMPALGLAGMAIGGVSSLLGIGGGTLTVPFLSWCGVAMHKAVATSAACGLPIAVAGAITYAVMGWGAGGLPAAAAGYLYLPALAGVATASVLCAPLGARLAHRLPTVVLRRLFAMFLAALGVWMLAG
jgi:uncharacterized membrane protein YfcA